jgi:C1A family cysteine protease
MSRYQNLFFGFLFIISFSSAVFAQELHPTGLIAEDLSKVSWIKPYVSLAKISSLPSSVDLSSKMPAVGNQGSLGSCVAWSVGYYAKTFEVGREKGWDLSSNTHVFSPTFLYNGINKGVDSGATLSDAAAFLINRGCAPISDCAIATSDYYSLASEAAFTSAINYRSMDAYSINTTNMAGVNTIREILASGKVATITIQVYDNFDNISSYNYVYCASQRTGSNRGGHAVTVVGYNDSLSTADGYGAFKLVNSWGTSWGISGYAWISYKALMDNYLSQGSAIMINNRTNYTPLLKAKLKITHSSRGYVSLTMSLGSAASPTMTIDESFATKTSVNRSFPSNNIIFDLTDFYSALTAGTASTINLTVADSKSDSYTAKIDSFYVVDILNNKTVNGLTSSVTLGTTESKTLSLSLTPATVTSKVNLLTPTNGDANVDVKPVLTWTSSGSSNYRVKVSTDDVNFDNNVMFSSTVTGTSVTLPSLTKNQIYFWKVADEATDNWSNIWSFKVTVINSSDYTASTQTYNWVDIASTGTAITSWSNIDSSGKSYTQTSKATVKDDGYSTNKIPIGFSFNFFGKTFDSLYVGVNGLVSFTNQKLNGALNGEYASTALGCFDQTYFPPENKVFPNAIAVAYDDFDLDNTDGYGGGKVVYKAATDKFVLSWINIGSFQKTGDTTNTFQLIFNKADNSIVMNYKNFGVTTTRTNIKSAIQKEDTLAVLWVAAGAPSAHLITNGSSVIYSKNLTSVGNNINKETKTFALGQNYPNPFNPSTVISYALKQGSRVSLKVYDLLGNEVASLVDEQKPAGEYFVKFNAATLASGIYFYRLSAGDFSEMKKMVFIK